MKDFIEGYVSIFMLLAIPYALAGVMLMHLVPILMMVPVWIISSLIITIGLIIYDKYL